MERAKSDLEEHRLACVSGEWALKKSVMGMPILQQILAASLASDRTCYACFRPTRDQVHGIPRFAQIQPIGNGILLVPWPSLVLSHGSRPHVWRTVSLP